MPTIGNEVFFGINSTIVGNIHSGNDVLIAPNSFVNFDVLDHFIVIENPGVIHYKENAISDYNTNFFILEYYHKIKKSLNTHNLEETVFFYLFLLFSNDI